MDAAIEELRSSTINNISEIARRHGVNRSTLSRRFRGITLPKALRYENIQLLNKQQEDELINWISRQCERCLPPTPTIVANIAAQLAGKTPGKNWCSAFVRRHKDRIDSRYLNRLDLSRHQANTRASYLQCFKIIGGKLEQYNITADNIYNMDEKGFMIGQIQKSERIFTKASYDADKLPAAGQDGNREWIPVLATICANGTALPPALIYKASSGNLQDTWLEEFDPQRHNCQFSASPNGWTSDEHGFEWLQNIFDKESKRKARRSWRLLFLDGHGSHLNLTFLNWCEQHRILVACYPPHSTHALQPLDVGCFAPLANNYSTGLDALIRKSEGHTRIKKRDFFSIFWAAYEKTFRKEVIDSAWSKTGIWPWNPEAVLKAFPEKPSSSDQSYNSKKRRSSSPLSGLNTPTKITKTRRSLNRLTATSSPSTSRKIKRLGRALVKTSCELTIARIDNQNLQDALAREKRHKTRQKKVLEQLRADEGTGTLFMSPSKVQRARDIASSREREKEQLEQDKIDRVHARALQKVQKEGEACKRREARAIARAEKQEAAAQKKASLQNAREAKKAQKELEKATKQRPRPCGRPPTKPIVKKQKVVKEIKELPQKVLKPQKSTRGRVVKPSAKLRT